MWDFPLVFSWKYFIVEMHKQKKKEKDRHLLERMKILQRVGLLYNH